MTSVARGSIGIPGQRGFWPRCFLGRSLLAVGFCLLPSAAAWAKVEAPGPMHLWRIHGFFVDPSGKPIQNVEVTLVRDASVAYRTKTDASGRFAFDHASGKYRLHIDKSTYSELSREVIVGLETATMLRRVTLYVIAGPGACSDDCSTLFTSKSDFDKAIRRNTGHGD